MRFLSTKSLLALLALSVALAGASAYAQGRGHGGGGAQHGGGFPGGGFPGGSHRGGFPGDNRSGFPNNDRGGFGGNVPHTTPVPRPHSTHAVVQLGPTARWWDDKKFSRSVGVDDATRKRMDSIFNENKSALSGSYNNLQHEEKILGKLVGAKQPDEASILAQIDRVSQARAELEKASARLVLALKRTLTPEQQAKLEAKTREMQDEPPPQEPQ